MAGSTIARADICAWVQERDATDRPTRIAKPSADLGAAGRERAIEDIRISTDCASGSVRVGQDEDATDDFGLPAESLEKDVLTDEPRLLIEFADRGLETDEFALDLLDDDRALDGPGSQDIDRAALSIDGVADLGVSVPPVATERPHGRRDQLGVALIEQPIQGRAAPDDVALEPAPDHLEDAAQVAVSDPGDRT